MIFPLSWRQVTAMFHEQKQLYQALLSTPLGPMLAIADEGFLYLLEFVDRPILARKVEQLQQRTQAQVISGFPAPIMSIADELRAYFEKGLQEFTTPLYLVGSMFQKRVWEELRKISIGKTKSYSAIANAIARPTACRAVAQANSTNQIAIVIPCHRVIQANGKLGGYAGGILRKQWLLHHERNIKE